MNPIFKLFVFIGLATFSYQTSHASCNGDVDCLFSTNFDALAEWEGCKDGSSGCTSNECHVGLDGLTEGNCKDHPLAPERCIDCDPVPDNYSFYRSSGANGIGGNARACNITGFTHDNRPAWGGDGKMMVHRLGDSGGAHSDCILTWWDADEQWPEIWTIYSYRADTNGGAFFKYAGNTEAFHDMKQRRIGHYKGRGPASDCNPFNFFTGGTSCNLQMGLQFRNFTGESADFRFVHSPKCYNQYRPCPGMAETYPRNYSPNVAETRYCQDQNPSPLLSSLMAPDGSPRTCTNSGSPNGLDISQCVTDTSCNGPLVPDGSFGGGGHDAYMAGHIMDGNWHTVMMRQFANSPTGTNTANGGFELYVDGVLASTRADVPFFDQGTPSSATGWNWVELGGNVRGDNWPAGLGNEINQSFDNWCIATTEAAALACHQRFVAGTTSGDNPPDNTGGGNNGDKGGNDDSGSQGNDDNSGSGGNDGENSTQSQGSSSSGGDIGTIGPGAQAPSGCNHSGMAMNGQASKGFILLLFLLPVAAWFRLYFKKKP